MSDLTLDVYQHKARSTAIYPGQGTFIGLSYVAHKMAGETGEVSELVGKHLRDDANVEFLFDDARGEMFKISNISDARREKLIKEVGDVLWYIANIATELGSTLSEIAQKNLDKLADRKKRGVLHGEGSER